MRQIQSIQVLRGAAALAVTAAHSSLEANFVAGQTVMPFWPRYGAVGVDLFFVISGFVMVYASEQLFAAPGGVIQFATKRLIRIVPLYWLLTSVVLLQSWHLNSTPDCVAASYLFTPCGPAPVLGSGWTLNYEMFFYALFALAVALPQRKAVLAIIAALCLFTALRNVLPFPLSYWAARPVDGSLHGVVLEFAMGAGIALLYREGFRTSRLVALSMLLTGVAAFLAASRYDLHTISLPIFWGIPCALIVAGAILAGSPRESHVWNWLLVLGNASYSLYLTHGIVQVAMRTDGLPVSHALALVSPWLYAVVLTVLCVAVSLPVYRFIEIPMTDGLRSKWLHRSNVSQVREPMWNTTPLP